MSARQVDVLEVLSRYVTGFFPLYDPWDRFYWERLPLRAVLPVTPETRARAARLKRRAWKTLTRDGPVEVRYTTALHQVIRHLQDESVKEHSWVRQEVVRIYEALHACGLLQTLELWQQRDNSPHQLIGGLVGIVLPGTFIAETMFGLVPEASKVCVCQLIEDCWPPEGHGDNKATRPLFDMIDVQTPHDLESYAMLMDMSDAIEQEPADRTAHPCIRIGEETLMLRDFMVRFTRAWKASFAGGVEEWMRASAALQLASRGDSIARAASGLPHDQLERAYRLLRHTLPPDFHPTFA